MFGQNWQNLSLKVRLDFHHYRQLFDVFLFRLHPSGCCCFCFKCSAVNPQGRFYCFSLKCCASFKHVGVITQEKHKHRGLPSSSCCQQLGCRCADMQNKCGEVVDKYSDSVYCQSGSFQHTLLKGLHIT